MLLASVVRTRARENSFFFSDSSVAISGSGEEQDKRSSGGNGENRKPQRGGEMTANCISEIPVKKCLVVLLDRFSP